MEILVKIGTSPQIPDVWLRNLPEQITAGAIIAQVLEKQPVFLTRMLRLAVNSGSTIYISESPHGPSILFGEMEMTKDMVTQHQSYWLMCSHLEAFS